MTNERQRRYAVETRRGEKAGGALNHPASVEGDDARTTNGSSVAQGDVESQGANLSPSAYRVVFTAYSGVDVPGGERLLAAHSTSPSAVPDFLTVCKLATAFTSTALGSDEHIVDTRVSDLLQIATNMDVNAKGLIGLGADGVESPMGRWKVSVTGPSGLHTVCTEEEWDEALREVRETAWMESGLRVVVRIRTAE